MKPQAKPKPKPKHQRLKLIGIALASVAAGVAVIAYTLSRNMVFFYTPAMIAQNPPDAGRQIRLGGRVKPGTVQTEEGLRNTFTIYDGIGETVVRYQGILPDLFREEQGIIAEGALAQDGTFAAQRVLAKHDENYMPPEVARALKEQGLWKDGAPVVPPSAVPSP
jgi:cytochrome c-type biogenesis protein CcmE